MGIKVDGVQTQGHGDIPTTSKTVTNDRHSDQIAVGPLEPSRVVGIEPAVAQVVARRAIIDVETGVNYHELGRDGILFDTWIARLLQRTPQPNGRVTRVVVIDNWALLWVEDVVGSRTTVHPVDIADEGVPRTFRFPQSARR
jgi:hypothetical protein